MAALPGMTFSDERLNEEQISAEPTVFERLKQKFSKLRSHSVTEPGFVDSLTAPIDTELNFSNLASVLGGRVREMVIDPIKKYKKVVDKGMSGKPLSVQDLIDLTSVNLDYVAGTGFLGGAKRIDPNMLRSFPAWHGGGKGFTKFSDEFIGSGEGSQAFSRGHYLTDSGKFADDYARTIANDQFKEKIKYKGEDLVTWANKDNQRNLEGLVISKLCAIDAKLDKKTIKEQLAILKINLSQKHDRLSQENVFAIGELDNFNVEDIITTIDNMNIDNFDTPPGDTMEHLYKTTVMKGKDPSEYVFMDWDKSIYAQPRLINKLKKTAAFKNIKAANSSSKIIYDGKELGETQERAWLWSAIWDAEDKKIPLNAAIRNQKQNNINEINSGKPRWPLNNTEAEKAIDFYNRVDPSKVNIKKESIKSLSTEDFYDDIKQYLGKKLNIPNDLDYDEACEIAATKFLLDNGISGVVFDAGTLSLKPVKPGTKNYVVFNPEDITINEHYVNGVLQGLNE